MELAGQKFVVTGGAGFIGSHVVDALLASGARVVVVDDLSAGSEANIVGVSQQIGFIHASILDPDALETAIDGAAGVFHLAAVASVVASIDDPIQTHAVNATGTLQLLEAARRANTKVVFSSSAAVYGDAPTVPKAESMPAAPTTPYGSQKLLGELYLANYHRLHGLAAVALRYFNVYGPRQDPTSMYSGVVSAFCDRVKSGQPLTINGDGNATRDFIYVGDVVQANLNAMTSGVSDARPLNVGTGQVTSILQLAKTVHELYGKPEQIAFGPARPGDIRHSHADNSAAKQSIGFRPKVGLSEGLSRTLGLDI